MESKIKLLGITDITHTYTSGPEGGNVTVGLQNHVDENVTLRFEEPNGVEVYDVQGCIEHDLGWNVIDIPETNKQNITFWFRRDGKRDTIKKQEITVYAYIENNKMDEISFEIEG